MTNIGIKLQVRLSELSELSEKTQNLIVSKLTQEQKVELFEALKQTQYLLPRTQGSFYKGFNLVEFPDGWQVEVNDDIRNSHKVSHDLYATRNDAHNAFELGLVDWNDLNESPKETYERASLEDRKLLDNFLAS